LSVTHSSTYLSVFNVKRRSEYCISLAISPDLEELAKEYGDKAVYLKVNVDDNEEVAEKFEVTALPRVLCLVKGDKVGEMFGNKIDNYKEFFKTQLA